MKISVIMACYNSEPFLAEAIESILAQSFGDFEIIAVDDKSTDDTLSILNTYRQNDSRIKILPLEKNLGAAGARNAGLSVARGEWIAVLDSDDIAMPSRFSEQLALVEGRPQVVLAASACTLVDKLGQKLKDYVYPLDHERLLGRLETRGAFPPHSSMLYRRSAVEAVGGFRTAFVPSEDYDLWLRLSECGEIVASDKVLVKIRKHEGSISNMEGGKRQLRLGVAAAVCHFLRMWGHADPASDDEASKMFIAWIDALLQKRGIYKQATELEVVKNNLRKYSIIAILNDFCCLRTFTLLKSKIIPPVSPEAIAKEWINHGS